jgi:hypothetical protein
MVVMLTMPGFAFSKEESQSQIGNIFAQVNPSDANTGVARKRKTTAKIEITTTNFFAI